MQGNQDKRVCRERVVDLGKRYRRRNYGILFNLIIFYLMNNCMVGGSPRPTVEWLFSDGKLVSRAKHLTEEGKLTIKYLNYSDA